MLRRLLLSISLLLCSFLYFTITCFARTYVYDEFSSLNQRLWKVVKNEGDVYVQDGNLNITSRLYSFPVLYSKFGDPFDRSEDGVLEVKYRFLSNGTMGDGISIGFTGNETYPFYQFSLWKDVSTTISYVDFNVQKYSYCNPSQVGEDIYDRYNMPVINDNNWHVLRVEYHSYSKWFSYYIDKTSPDQLPVYSTRANQCLPPLIILGNPLSGGMTDWNDLQVDYVRSYTLGDTQFEVTVDPDLVVTPTPTPVPMDTVTPTQTSTPTLTPTLTSTPTPTLTPTPTFTPSPTPTSTPTAVPKTKVIIIPGLGASWNTEAILNNRVVATKEWRMTPFVDNYDGLVGGLEANGWVRGVDFWVWNYDWRRPIAEINSEFDKFVAENFVTNDKVLIVGHSLGGMVGRTWLQDGVDRYPNFEVVSMAGPQQGAIVAYTLWNGGMNFGKDDVSASALSILLRLRQLGRLTRAEVIREEMPVFRDLIPVFDFVKKNNQVIKSGEIQSRNLWLTAENNNSLKVFPKFEAVVGVGVGTPRWVLLSSRSWIDERLNLWPDGSMAGYQVGNGDGTVVEPSQMFAGDPAMTFRTTHGEVVNDSLKYIGEKLDWKINVKGETKNKQIYFIGSPAYLLAKCPGRVDKVSDENGFLILDASFKNCQVWLVGTDRGTYHLVTGWEDNQDSWTYREGEVEKGKVVEVTVRLGGSKQYKQDIEYWTKKWRESRKFKAEWEKFGRWWKVGRYYDCLAESARLLGDKEMDYIGEGISFNLINLMDINDWKKVGSKKVYLKDSKTAALFLKSELLMNEGERDIRSGEWRKGWAKLKLAELILSLD